MHSSVKGESAEVPRQQEAKSLEGRTIDDQLQESSQTISSNKEPKMRTERAVTLLESQDPCTFETPLIVICPEVLDSSQSHHNGNVSLQDYFHICFINWAPEYPIFRF